MGLSHCFLYFLAVANHFVLNIPTEICERYKKDPERAQSLWSYTRKEIAEIITELQNKWWEKPVSLFNEKRNK